MLSQIQEIVLTFYEAIASLNVDTFVGTDKPQYLCTNGC